MSDSSSRNSSKAEWMIYGAYGFTGALVAEEAVRRGHRPVLAGRSKKRLVPLAERLGLDWVRLDLCDANALAKAVGQVELVFHAAGPFIHTSEPVLGACLKAGTHYVDITGEIPVFRNTFAHDRLANQRGVALISGAGFDVIPTDCLAEHVASQVPYAVELETGIMSLGRPSAGTTKTMLELFPGGGMMRRDGQLVPQRWGTGVKRIRFPRGERTAFPIPWGDLETAYQTTGIPNITTYLAFPKNLIRLLRWSAPLGQQVLWVKAIRRVLQMGVERAFHGPDEKTRQTRRTRVWARAADKSGNEAQAWLETPEAYQFTAMGGVRCVERVLLERPVGALTPALAFGADFVLEVEGTQRFDNLPASA
jgi:short subunit dehydrogenase-like uncharacterized protein